MIIRYLLAAVLGLGAAGCMAGIETGIEELHPAERPVQARRVAVLPVITDEGADAYEGLIGDSLLAVARRAYPGITFVPPAETAERLRAAGVADRFRALRERFADAGEYDAAVLREVGRAVDADHVLQLSAGYDVVAEEGSSVLGPDASYEADRQTLYVGAVLWDVREGALAWQAEGSGTTRDAEYERPASVADIVAATAGRLARRIPFAPADAQAPRP
jgi:hypothetical protein